MLKYTFVLALGIIVMAAIVALQNAQSTRVTFFAWEFEGPLVLVLLVTFATGILAGWLAALPSIWKRSRKLAELKRESRQIPPAHGGQG
jgi:uncharacterized integral membrane protein